MSRTRLLALVVALVAVTTAARVAVAASGYFYWDDLLLHARAAAHPTPDAALLLSDHDGHLMPGGMALSWLAAHAAPLRWWMPVAQIAVLQLAASAALARLLWVLQRGSPWLLAPLTVALASPLSLPSVTWWAAALMALPLAATLAWASTASVLLARTGRWPHAVSALVAVAVGLVFTEKAVVVPVVAALVALADPAAAAGAQVDEGAEGRVTLRERVRRLAPTWAGHVALVAAWAAVYVHAVGDPADRGAPDGAEAAGGTGAGSGAGTVELLDHAYRLAVAPALAGGPWRWGRWHPGPPFADPPAAVVVAGALLTLVLVVRSVAVRRGVARVRVAAVWAVAAAYPAASVLAVSWARRGPGTAAEIVQTLRYHGDSVVVLAAAGALVLATGGRGTTGRAGAPTAIALVAAVVASSAVSTATYRASWSDQPSRRYLEPLLAELHGRTSPLLDQQVPPEVLLPVVHPDDRLSRVLAGVEGIPPVGPWTDDPVVVDDRGRLLPADVTWSRRLGPGPEPGCGHRIAADGGRIALDGPLIEREWTVRLNYFAGADGTVRVALDGGPAGGAGPGPAVEVPLRAGLHSVVVRLDGGGDGLWLAPSPEVGTLCVGDGPVGVLIPR